MTQRAVDGLEQLIRDVGHGSITARCVVDQPYAQRQHEEVTWRHPHGGQAKYLEGPLFENADHIVHIMGTNLLTVRGSSIREGMIEISEMMSNWVENNAPKLTDELATSGHPMVIDEEFGTIYDRSPKTPRIDIDQHKPTQH